MPRLLILFTLCNLVVGTGAFVIGGILSLVATGLDTTVPRAGQAMTAYALATAVLAPTALLLTGRWPRKRVLLVAMAVFAAGNTVCALAESLPTLLAGRVLMGLGAVFTPVAAGIAVASVPPARRGKALAFVFLGISLSYVVGLPLGAYLGEHHGWHAPLWLVTGAASVALAALWVAVPRDIEAPGASFAGLGRLLGGRAARATLGLTLLYFTAIFSVFSYIGPVLQALVPLSPAGLSLTLMVFGLSGVAGTLVGGWANDRFGPARTLAVQLVLLASMMAVVPLTRGHYGPMLAAFVVWGTAGFGMMAPQQSRLAALAPSQAPLLLSLNTSMLYVGTAFGAVVGGAAVGVLGLASLAWAGLPFALLGLSLLRFSLRAA
jgi:DHA1 family inner membrane transport protein